MEHSRTEPDGVVESEYRQLACKLLGVDSLDWPILPVPDWDDPDWPPRQYVGDLTPEQDQQLCAVVCKLARGMTASHWDGLSEGQRLPWLQEAALQVAQPADSVGDNPSQTSIESDGAELSSTEGAIAAPNWDEQDETASPSNEQATQRILSLLTDGVADDRINQAITVLQDNTLTVNDRLTRIDALIKLPATASSKQLGMLFGVKKQAVLKTKWWTQNRRGEKANEIGQRQNVHKARAEEYEPNRRTDEGE